jgi:hypothetical protein
LLPVHHLPKSRVLRNAHQALWVIKEQLKGSEVNGAKLSSFSMNISGLKCSQNGRICHTKFYSVFPGFHLQTLRRKPRSASQILADKLDQLKQNLFSQLGDCFSHFIPKYLLQPAGSGALSRQRFFSKENTFWAFFSQALDADGGCKEVVRKLQALSAMKSKPLPSSSTAAYC